MDSTAFTPAPSNLPIIGSATWLAPQNVFPPSRVSPVKTQESRPPRRPRGAPVFTYTTPGPQCILNRPRHTDMIQKHLLTPWIQRRTFIPPSSASQNEGTINDDYSRPIRDERPTRLREHDIPAHKEAY
ncbi:hypothetical protein E4U12_001369 [Claviceps purpurea]|nr:hypothetical protein E4U12_001369 [Claviceps purpurea]